MNGKYVIKKILYGQHDFAESFSLDFNFPCDAYGVYQYKGSPELPYWVDDFKTLPEAEKFILEQEG